MRRHVPKPLHAGGLVGLVRLPGANVDLARNGLVDEGLFLLLQQRNQLLLGADVAPDAPVGVIEEADDSGLFREGRECNGFAEVRRRVEVLYPRRLLDRANVESDGVKVRVQVR